eukprot:gene14897-20034_t
MDEEELFAYSESVKGQYTPLVAIFKYDGTISYRDINKFDMTRIPNSTSKIPSLPISGSWLFRKAQNSSTSWAKRYCILRGDFIFLYHSPSNEKPIAVVPLEGCTIVIPENNGKSFTPDEGNYIMNEGFEFDIKHNIRATARFYTINESERADWVNACRERSSTADQIPHRGADSNIIITGTSLVTEQVQSTNRPKTESNPYLPPGLQNIEDNSFNNTSISRPSQNNNLIFLTPSLQIPPDSISYGQMSPNFIPSMSASNTPFTQKSDSVYIAANYENDKSVMSNTNLEPSNNENKPSRLGSITKKPMKRGTLSVTEVNVLENSLMNKMLEQTEARQRESAARTKISSRESVMDLRKKEEVNPLTLAELFRTSLFLIDEELVEDPIVGTPLAFPHFKGNNVEQIMTVVYQKYCGPSGYMSIEQFVEFMEESGIMQSHVPHDENDEPLAEFRTLLDPVRLLTLVPRNLGFASGTIYNDANDAYAKAAKSDKFIVNFTQFYQLIQIITQIVYSELYETDTTLAVNRFIQEVMAPLFVWCKGHYKRGCQDMLLLEERILLLVLLYSPNLWRVFLTYATDALGKVTEINQPFPEAAQMNDRGLFKLPLGAPLRHQDSKPPTSDSLIMSELGCARFAADYGITSHLIGTKQLRDIYRRTNRVKVIISSRLPTRDLIQTKPLSQAQESKLKRKKEAVTPMTYKKATSPVSAKKGLNRVNASKQAPPPPLPTGIEEDDQNFDGPPPPPPPASSTSNLASNRELGGLGFSEFLEFIARIAVEGMEQENYHILFPTPFSK